MNERKLFPDIGHTSEFSINIYGTSRDQNSFESISTLYHPNDLKKVNSTQKNRIIKFDINSLQNISKIFGGKPDSPILPTLPINDYLPILAKFLTSNRRLIEYEPYLTISTMWHESGAVKEGIIKPYNGNNTHFPKSPEELILNGPHLWINNPLYKCPNNPCLTKLAWKEVDTNRIDASYLPRTKFTIPDKKRYQSNLQKVNWYEIPLKEPSQPITNYYRIALREYVNPGVERTLIPSIIPPGEAHVNAIVSFCLKPEEDLLLIEGFLSSLILDFYVRQLNKGHINPSLLQSLPIPNLPNSFTNIIKLRVLALNSLTKYYAIIWKKYWSDSFKIQSWSSCDFRLNHGFFKSLTEEWSLECCLKNELERRQAQLEIDVMTAIAFGFDLSQLIWIYENGFPVMKAYEDSNFYDQKGQLVFTSSKGLPNTGLPIQSKSSDTFFYLIDGQKVINFKFEDIKNKKEGTVSKIFNDSTQLGNPEIKITYVAPFFKKNRIEDYKEAWGYFEKILKESPETN